MSIYLFLQLEYHCGGKQPELQAHGSEGFGFKELPGMMIAWGIMADKRITFFWWWNNIKHYACCNSRGHALLGLVLKMERSFLGGW